MWPIGMGYHSATKTDEVLIQATARKKLENIMLSE